MAFEMASWYFTMTRAACKQIWKHNKKGSSELLSKNLGSLSLKRRHTKHCLLWWRCFTGMANLGHVIYSIVPSTTTLVLGLDPSTGPMKHVQGNASLRIVLDLGVVGGFIFSTQRTDCSLSLVWNKWNVMLAAFTTSEFVCTLSLRD